MIITLIPFLVMVQGILFLIKGLRGLPEDFRDMSKFDNRSGLLMMVWIALLFPITFRFWYVADVEISNTLWIVVVILGTIAAVFFFEVFRRWSIREDKLQTASKVYGAMAGALGFYSVVVFFQLFRMVIG